MQLGMVGLGRMGAGMTDRLRERGHDMKTYDPNVESTAGSLEELVQQLDKPRSVWMMVPAAIVDGIIADLAPHLEEGDTIIDGGNSYYVDDLRRSGELSEKGLHYLDIGVSGGVWGLERGFCMMVGGDEEAVTRLSPSSTTSRRASRRRSEHRDVKAIPRSRRKAGSTAARAARATSSRWSTTGSSTGSCRPTRKG